MWPSSSPSVQGCFSECYLNYQNSEPSVNDQLREWWIKTSEVSWGPSVGWNIKAPLKVFWWIFFTVLTVLCSSLPFSGAWKEDWPLQTYHPGYLALLPHVGFRRRQMLQDVGEVEEGEVWVSTSPSGPSASVWSWRWLWPSMTTVSVGQLFVHTPSSQVSFKVGTNHSLVSGCFRIPLLPFSCPSFCEQSLYNNILAEYNVCFLLWHWENAHSVMLKESSRQ